MKFVIVNEGNGVKNIVNIETIRYFHFFDIEEHAKNVNNYAEMNCEHCCYSLNCTRSQLHDFIWFLNGNDMQSFKFNSSEVNLVIDNQ